MLLRKSYKSNLIAYCLDCPEHKQPRSSPRLRAHISLYNIIILPGITLVIIINVCNIIIILCSRCKTSSDTVVYHLSIIIKIYTRGIGIVNIAVLIRRV